MLWVFKEAVGKVVTFTLPYKGKIKTNIEPTVHGLDKFHPGIHWMDVYPLSVYKLSWHESMLTPWTTVTFPPPLFVLTVNQCFINFIPEVLHIFLLLSSPSPSLPLNHWWPGGFNVHRQWHLFLRHISARGWNFALKCRSAGLNTCTENNNSNRNISLSLQSCAVACVSAQDLKLELNLNNCHRPCLGPLAWTWSSHCAAYFLSCQAKPRLFSLSAL